MVAAGGPAMLRKSFIFIVLAFTVSGCVPLAVGAGAAVIGDEIAEDRSGGDGLF
jgi:hypothetical protein